MKIINFNQKAFKKLLKGSNILAKAVGTTLGSRGRCVGIDKGYEHIILHDGVSVAKAIELSDPTENLGVKIVREAAQKQVMAVGDGTTAVTILSDEIIKECYKLISAGINPMSLRKGLESGRDKLVAELDKITTPIKGEMLKQVATISAEDEELGELVASVLEKTGIDGIVTIEESKGADTWVDYQEGMQFGKGYCSHLFINNPDTEESTIENPYILVTDKSVNDVMELAPLFTDMSKQNLNNLVIIAPEIGGTALPSLITTKMKGAANILCIHAPEAGEKQKLYLQDIAVLTGATFISQQANMKLEDLEIKDLGRADRITSDKYTTIIVGGKGIKEDIQDRVEGIKKAMENETSEWELAKLKERQAKLTNGVAVIRVGGSTEVEMKERKERVDDAVHATKASMIDGIVPGGEIIYEKISHVLDTNNFGERILKEAIKRPFNTLIKNAGYDAGEMRTLVSISKLDNAGVDVNDGEIKDMVKEGIIDPTSVVKQAIINSVSVAIQLQSIGATIVNEMPSVPQK